MWIPRSSRVVTALALVCVCATSAYAQDAAATFQRAVDRYKSAKTLKVQFLQTLSNTLLGTTSSTKAELLRKQPNLFAINFTKPASDRIVSDGSSVWLYLPSSAPGQVIKAPAKGAGAMFVDPLEQVLSSSKDRYTIQAAGRETVNGKQTRAVTLTPKSDGGVFTSAKIWVEETSGIVWQIETKEASGIQRKIVVQTYASGVEIPESAFRFKVPPKVRVVDQAAILGRD